MGALNTVGADFWMSVWLPIPYDFCHSISMCFRFPYLSNNENKGKELPESWCRYKLPDSGKQLLACLSCSQCCHSWVFNLDLFFIHYDLGDLGVFLCLFNLVYTLLRKQYVEVYSEDRRLMNYKEGDFVV